MVEQSYGRGVVYVLLAVVGWSLSGVFVRFLPDLSGWQINCWRGYWMSVALLIYLIAVYGRDTPRRFLEIPLPGLVRCRLLLRLRLDALCHIAHPCEHGGRLGDRRLVADLCGAHGAVDHRRAGRRERLDRRRQWH